MAQRRRQVPRIEIPLGTCETGADGTTARCECVFAGDVPACAIGELQSDLLLGLRRQRGAHRVADGCHVAGFAYVAGSQSNLRPVDEEFDRGLVHLRALLRDGQLDLRNRGDIHVTGSRLSQTDIRRGLDPRFELAIHFDMAGCDAVVE